MDQIASVLQIAVGIAVLPVANVVDQSASVLQIAVLLVANVVDQSASVLQNAVLLLPNVAHKPTEIEHFKPVTKCRILFIAFIIYHCMLCSVVCIQLFSYLALFKTHSLITAILKPLSSSRAETTLKQEPVTSESCWYFSLSHTTKHSGL